MGQFISFHLVRSINPVGAGVLAMVRFCHQTLEYLSGHLLKIMLRSQFPKVYSGTLL